MCCLFIHYKNVSIISYFHTLHLLICRLTVKGGQRWWVSPVGASVAADQIGNFFESNWIWIVLNWTGWFSCVSFRPGVYTKLVHYLPWIHSKLSGNWWSSFVCFCSLCVPFRRFHSEYSCNTLLQKCWNNSSALSPFIQWSFVTSFWVFCLKSSYSRNS